MLNQLNIDCMVGLFWSFYYSHGKILVPSFNKTTAGVYMVVEPITVVDIGDRRSLKEAIVMSIERGNPIIPHPNREEMSKPNHFFKRLGFKTHKSFFNTASRWDVWLSDGIFGIQSWKDPDGTNYRSPDTSKKITLPPNTTVESVVDKLFQMIDDEHKRQSGSRSEVISHTRHTSPEGRS